MGRGKRLDRSVEREAVSDDRLGYLGPRRQQSATATSKSREGPTRPYMLAGIRLISFMQTA